MTATYALFYLVCYFVSQCLSISLSLCSCGEVPQSSVTHQVTLSASGEMVLMPVMYFSIIDTRRLSTCSGHPLAFSHICRKKAMTNSFRLLFAWLVARYLCCGAASVTGDNGSHQRGRSCSVPADHADVPVVYLHVRAHWLGCRFPQPREGRDHWPSPT
jgi:hypothetical protein